MLLEFELENDRAFAEAGALSLVAGKLREENVASVVDVGDPGETKALTSALILGKNGSGKSTVVDALRFVSSFVRSSAKNPKDDRKIPYDPNILGTGLESAPTRYRIVFSMHGTVYEFEFSHDAERIHYESLQVADRSVRFRRMYERRWKGEDQSYLYSFGEALSGRKVIWQESTRPNALFLSTAAMLNSEDISPAFDWLSSFVRTAEVSGESTDRYSAKKCFKSPEYKTWVVNFLKCMDVNVEDIEIEEEPADEKMLRTTFAAEFFDTISKSIGHNPLLSSTYRVKFIKRKFDGGLVRLALTHESTGTISLFNLAAPLYEALRGGYCLLIDEINTSLHPIIVSFLVDMFANREINKKRAQLIFTSHDVSVLAKRKMRRDQVWFVENDGSGSYLVPLSDFSPRRDEALDKGYLGGRYGGIPVVSPALLTIDNGDD